MGSIQNSGRYVLLLEMSEKDQIMGYVIVSGNGEDEPDVVYGLEAGSNDRVFICDNCNEPKISWQGHSVMDSTGLDLMWVCSKCHIMNHV